MRSSGYISEPSRASAEAGSTDYELLERFLGPDYFILKRIKAGISLTPPQQTELFELIEERNHFGILAFVDGLRK